MKEQIEFTKAFHAAMQNPSGLKFAELLADPRFVEPTFLVNIPPSHRGSLAKAVVAWGSWIEALEAVRRHYATWMEAYGHHLK